MSAARSRPESHEHAHASADDAPTKRGGCGPGCGCSHGDDAGRGAGGNDTAGNPEASESIEARVERLERDLADAQEQRLRLIAEYQTSQRRALESEARARGAGVADAARQVIPVIDHLDLALGQKSGMSAEKAIEGLSMLRSELMKAFEKSGIETISPRPGDEFDPHQHEAVMRQPAQGVATDCISVVFQPGYRLGETVLRAAKVAVAP